MRIISDFHDYYDGVQRYGQSDDLLYVRKLNQVKLAVSLPGIERNWSRKLFVCSANYVGFCGTAFPYVELSRWHSSKSEMASAICWSVEDADKFCEANLKKRELDEYHSNDKFSFTVTRRKLANFFDQDRQALHRIWLALAQTPVFITKTVSDTRFVDHDGRLADVEFFRVLDAYQAFQRLQQYLSNQAKPEKPIPHIDDRTMAEAKGFDKWSFRKEPKAAKR